MLENRVSDFYYYYYYYYYAPDLRRSRKMVVSVCPSICLSVACVDVTRKLKGLGSPNLAGWKPIIRVTHEPI